MKSKEYQVFTKEGEVYYAWKLPEALRYDYTFIYKLVFCAYSRIIAKSSKES